MKVQYIIYSNLMTGQTKQNKNLLLTYLLIEFDKFFSQQLDFISKYAQSEWHTLCLTCLAIQSVLRLTVLEIVS